MWAWITIGGRGALQTGFAACVTGSGGCSNRSSLPTRSSIIVNALATNTAPSPAAQTAAQSTTANDPTTTAAPAMSTTPTLTTPTLVPPVPHAHAAAQTHVSCTHRNATVRSGDTRQCRRRMLHDTSLTDHLPRSHILERLAPYHLPRPCGTGTTQDNSIRRQSSKTRVRAHVRGKSAAIPISRNRAAELVRHVYCTVLCHWVSHGLSGATPLDVLWSVWCDDVECIMDCPVCCHWMWHGT